MQINGAIWKMRRQRAADRIACCGQNERVGGMKPALPRTGRC